MPQVLDICRICMSVNIKMFTFKNTNMENLYNLLTQVDTEHGKPTTVCFLCYARLRQCERLRQQAIKSNELLNQLLKGGIMPTTNAVLNSQYSSQDLQVSSTYYLEVGPTNCKDDFLDPKIEANDLTVVKKEKEEAIDEECHVTENEILSCQYSSRDLQDSSTYYLELEPMICRDDLLHPKVEANNLKSVKAEGERIIEGFNVTENHCLIQQEREIKKGHHQPNATQIQKRYKISYNNEEGNKPITEEFACKDDLDQYIRTQTGEKPFTCNICEYRCTLKVRLKEHIRIHTGEKPFSCNICEYKSAQNSALKRHIRTHTGEKPFSCTICGCKCANKSGLKRHIITHTGEKPYSCNFCEYRCAQKNDLKLHMRTHTGEKPFSCNICEYKCAQKVHLIVHKRTHTGEKPFSCNICGSRFANRSDLKRHIRRHTGEKPFSCNFCEYRCAQKYDLKLHMRTHTDEKPFSCNNCGYRCTQKAHLEKHMRTHGRETMVV